MITLGPTKYTIVLTDRYGRSIDREELGAVSQARAEQKLIARLRKEFKGGLGTLNLTAGAYLSKERQ